MPWHAVAHYENFPVGSWLMPRRLRPAVVAIYRFARAADDIADEGTASAAQRLAALQWLDTALRQAAGGEVTGIAVVDALVRPVRTHGLSWQHFHDLLTAFRQDLEVRRYADALAIDDYCRHSAWPVGRLILELDGTPRTAQQLHQSDLVCGALQKINFLQDVVSDWGRDRIYLTAAACRAQGLDPEQLGEQIARGRLSPAWRQVLRSEARQAASEMLAGAPLAVAVGGRLGWELRAVIAGGLRILERLDALDYDVVLHRPTLGWLDAPALLRLMGRAPPRPRLDSTGAIHPLNGTP